MHVGLCLLCCLICHAIALDYRAEIQAKVSIIFQYGLARTATTFQSASVSALVGLMPPLRTEFMYVQNISDWLADNFTRAQAARKNHGVVTIIKSHNRKMSNWHYINSNLPPESYLVFITRPSQTPKESKTDFIYSFPNIKKRIAFVQTFSDVTRNWQNVSFAYLDLFRHEVGSDESKWFMEFFRYYVILRRCCSSQASEDWRVYLNSLGPNSLLGTALVNSSAFKDKLDYDEMNCYIYNLTQVEHRMKQTHMCQAGMVHPRFCIPSPSCEDTMTAFMEGKGFNFDKL